MWHSLSHYLPEALKYLLKVSPFSLSTSTTRLNLSASLVVQTFMKTLLAGSLFGIRRRDFRGYLTLAPSLSDFSYRTVSPCD